MDSVQTYVLGVNSVTNHDMSILQTAQSACKLFCGLDFKKD